MDDVRWRRVKEIFEAALSLPPPERDAFLAEACAGDAGVLAEARSLLDAYGEEFLETPPAPPDTAFASAPTSDASARESRPTLVDGAVPRGKICPSCGARFATDRRRCPRDGAFLEPDLEALVGATLDGRYRIEAVLGKGGMGVVYRARHLLLDDVVAIKVLADRYASDAAFLRRFQREGQAARRLRHPAAVTVYDLRCDDDGPVYLAMEYVEGRTLGELLAERGRLSPHEAVRLLAPVAGALDEAHEAGVVHRDLKPENVMVAGDPVAGDPVAADPERPAVRLLDLGIAALRPAGGDPATHLTESGTWIGTPVYMAPEQWGAPQRDGEAEIDGRADVYSLGVLLFHLVAGRPPFSDSDVVTLRREHLTAPPPRLDARVEGVPERFASAVARAMEKDRADRFATAGGLLAELAASLEGERAGPPPGGTSPGGPPDATAGARPRTTGDFAAHSTGVFASTPNNLPPQATSFVAPDGAVEEVSSLLGRARLVTLVGPGGIGKTRLAVEVAARALGRFPQGVWLVELGAVADPRLVALTAAEAAGLRAAAEGETLETLREALSGGAALVVLDNCEHLVGACASFAAGLLAACPELRVLATSREALRAAGEVAWPVPPLAAPEAGAANLLAYPSVRLFLDRARSVLPSFSPRPDEAELIGRICARLDGLPLAIELAAARVRVLTLGEIHERLSSRFRLLSSAWDGEPRRRTLRATIDWSYDLLSEPERALLRRLAVFAGGCTLDAAERVAAGGGAVDADDVLDLLSTLVAKSLVVADVDRAPSRYRMFESVREYALEKLDAAGERDRVSAAYAAWALDLAAWADEARLTPEQSAREERLLAEVDNLRAALELLAASPAGAAEYARMCGALGGFWEARGLLSEGRRWLGRVEWGGAPSPDLSLARFWAGVLAVDQGDYDAGRAALEEALAIGRAAGHDPSVARALRALGFQAMRRADEERALALLEEAAALYRALGDRRGEASASHLIATVAIGRSDFALAERLLEQTHALHRALGDRRSLAIDLYNLADVSRCLGDHERAARRADEAIRIAEEIGDAQTLGYAAYAKGTVEASRGDHRAALEAFRRTLEIGQAIGDEASVVYAVEGVAGALAGLGLHARALELAGAAEGRRESSGQRLSAQESADLEAALSPAREALGAGAAGAFGRGRLLPLSRAVALALDAGDSGG